MARNEERTKAACFVAKYIVYVRCRVHCWLLCMRILGSNVLLLSALQRQQRRSRPAAAATTIGRIARRCCDPAGGHGASGGGGSGGRLRHRINCGRHGSDGGRWAAPSAECFPGVPTGAARHDSRRRPLGTLSCCGFAPNRSCHYYVWERYHCNDRSYAIRSGPIRSSPRGKKTKKATTAEVQPRTDGTKPTLWSSHNTPPLVRRGGHHGHLLAACKLH